MLAAIFAYAIVLFVVSRGISVRLKAAAISPTAAALVLAATWAAIPLLPMIVPGSMPEASSDATLFLAGAAALMFAAMFVGLRAVFARV